jgi:hypothetical protein
VNPGPAQLDEFSLDPLFFKLLENISKQDGRVSAFSGATVQRDNFRPLQDLNLLSLAIQASRWTTAIPTFHCAPSAAAIAMTSRRGGPL